MGRPIKSLTPTELKEDQETLVARATRAGRSMTPAELRLFEELVKEQMNKEAIANEARLAEARGEGARRSTLQPARSNLTRDEIAAMNQPNRTKSDEIKARHKATLKRLGK